jgi:hypothetical protein
MAHSSRHNHALHHMRETLRLQHDCIERVCASFFFFFFLKKIEKSHKNKKQTKKKRLQCDKRSFLLIANACHLRGNDIASALPYVIPMCN